MKKFLSLFFILCTIMAEAQITGKVTDNAGISLPGASVALYNLNDELVTGTTTDVEGNFSIQAKPAKYKMVVSFIAFREFTRNIELTALNEEIDLGLIKLQEASTSLAEVVVEGQAGLMEFQQDKRVFNVSKDLSNIGSNASEILNNVPSVSVDVEGNVALRGSQNVRILIDGKPSSMVGSDPATALRLLQGNMIEKIEVITNPSARYDAEGEAGIINIVLKKEQRKGINGTFEANVGHPHNYGATAGINYRTGKFNWFANGSINYRQSPGGGINDQEFVFRDSANPQIIDTSYSRYTERDQIRGGTGAALRLGADYALTPTQTITGTFLYRPSLGHNQSDITYSDFYADGRLAHRSVREDREVEKELNLEGDLHYEKEFEGKDHKLTADFKFQDENDRENSDIREQFLGQDSLIFQKVFNQEDEQTILLQTDYIRPFTEKRKVEMGAKATLRDIINNYSVNNVGDGGSLTPLDQYTNNFRYLENIYAAYAMYSDGYKDITYQLGLRGEYSDITTELLRENEVNNKTYFNLFPSAFFTWNINKLSDFQLNYSRRLSRPRFRSLLPFFSFSDRQNFYSGNPDLDPEFTDSYETGYLRYWEKATLYTGIYYRHRTGVIERIRTVENDSGQTNTRPINLGIQDAYGLEINYTQDFTKWWSVNATLNLYNEITVGSYEGVDYGNTNFSSQGRIMNRFKFWNSDLQLSFNYRGPSTTAQGRYLGIYTADIGWARDVLKGNGTISLSIRDLFNTRMRRSYTYTEEMNSYSEFQWRQRQVSVSFVYRLNQKKSKSPQPREDGLGDDEGL